MEYIVNEDGVQALRELAYSVRDSSAVVQSAVNTVRSAADENAAAIGPHLSSLTGILEEVQAAEAAAAEAVQTVSDMLLDLARRYQEIIDYDPFAEIGLDAIAVGGAENTAAAAASSKPLSGSAEGADSDRTPAKGNWGFEYVPLLQTLQTTEKHFLSGRNVTIFDHPLDGNPATIYNQGSAYPESMPQTCGCCACGTLINKAGGFATERSVVTYARDNGFCTGDGMTRPKDWIGILNSAGITSRDCTGSTLEDLAAQVEQGRGVIIGVSACIYCPELYGRYSPLKADGHALVLESAVRDAETGKIIEYIVTDSNGKSAKGSCRRVPKAQMDMAFRCRGSQAITTDEIIW